MEKNWIIAIAVLAFMACSKPAEESEQRQALRVRTIEVAEQAGYSTMRYVGAIEAARETPLSMQNTGRVLHVDVKNGDRVQVGQPILRIDDTQARNAMATAEATLRHAQDGYNRTSKVHDKGVISDQKMVEIETELARAQALYDAAQKQLNECELIAPCTGVVHGLRIEAGQSIIPSATICTILDVSAFDVRFSVPEKEIGALQGLGQQGEMECAAVGQTYPIVVKEKGVKAHSLSHTYDVVAQIQGGQTQLMAGMVGVVRLQKEQEATIVIPASCVLLTQTGYTVWIKENGHAVRKNIVVGSYQANGVQVQEGLHIGDSLVIDGYQKIYNGCKLIENK